MSQKFSSKAVGNQHVNFEAIVPGVSQALAFTGTSAQSAALQASTTLIRLFATTDCFIQVGTNPTAAANTSMFIAAGIYEYIGVAPGALVAAIQSSAGGTLYITEAA